MNNTGTKIRNLRRSKGMTQEELAKAIGLKDKSSIAKIESGTNEISHDKLCRLCHALDTNADYLISDNDSMTSETTSNPVFLLSKL